MKLHKTATARHYNEEAANYDSFNEDNSKIINATIINILNRFSIKTVLDLTCGTGSQVFALAYAGFLIDGVDINSKMLKIAKEKAKKAKLSLKFVKGDCRFSVLGQYDVVITIFNAIGHLTKFDFEKTLKNIHENLNQNGIYIFDIFNLNYLLDGTNITKLTIDNLINNGNSCVREIQYSTIDKNGILSSYDFYYYETENAQKLKKCFQTLQIYNCEQLKIMLNNANFEIVEIMNVDGTQFHEILSERILIVARKK